MSTSTAETKPTWKIKRAGHTDQPLLDNLLADGWEPFCVTRGGLDNYIWLRKHESMNKLPLLCRWGFHAWRVVEDVFLSNAHTICREKCERCGDERLFDQQNYH